MAILEQRLREQVHFCWLTATAEVCQSQSLKLLDTLTVQDRQQDNEFYQSMFTLVVNASVVIQYAVITGKIKPEQSLADIQEYCLQILWHNQPPNFHAYLQQVAHIAWLLLQECFEEIASLAHTKLIAYLESTVSKRQRPKPEGYLEDGTPVWSLAALAKYSGQNVDDLRAQIDELLETNDSRVKTLPPTKVFTVH
jgi:hypothetical protein